MRQTGGRRRRCRVIVGLVVFFAAVLAAVPVVEAQQIRVPAPAQFDRIRVSGFLWRAGVSGIFGVRDSNVPGLGQGFDVQDLLGLTDSSNGWIVEAQGGGRRHRFIVAVSRIENTAQQSFTIGDLVLNADTAMQLTEIHAFYNFLLVAQPTSEIGLLAGVGRFEALATLQSSVGSARGELDTPFPMIGGNVMVNPKGPFRGYFEVTGFPRVSVDEFSGSQLDIVARLEIFPYRNYGVIVGYRRYKLRLDDDLGGVGIDLVWDGFTFGGQMRF